MADTHDYPTIEIEAQHLNEAHVIVGESGGLCAVYDSPVPLPGRPNLVVVSTEYGALVLGPLSTVQILAMVD